jgi:glutathione S-transferase
MVEYKLHYFNMRGLAELIRFVFAAADQKYEDFRFERDEWAANKHLSPTGQLPLLEVRDGSETFHLCQTVTIGTVLCLMK